MLIVVEYTDAVTVHAGDAAVIIGIYAEITESMPCLKGLSDEFCRLIIELGDVILYFLFRRQYYLRVSYIVKESAGFIEETSVTVQIMFKDVVSEIVDVSFHVSFQFFREVASLNVSFQLYPDPLFDFIKVFIVDHDAGRNDLYFLYVLDGSLGIKIKKADTVDLIVKELYSDRIVFLNGKNVYYVTAAGKGQRLIYPVGVTVAAFNQQLS